MPKKNSKLGIQIALIVVNALLTAIAAALTEMASGSTKSKKRKTTILDD